jgi:hypothetical protein
LWLCYIIGTVNGMNIYANAFFAYLAAGETAGQMQAALTALMWNRFAESYGYLFTPWPTPITLPTFPASNAIAQRTQGPYPQPPVVYTPALIGSWTA